MVSQPVGNASNILNKNDEFVIFIILKHVNILHTPRLSDWNSLLNKVTMVMIAGICSISPGRTEVGNWIDYIQGP